MKTLLAIAAFVLVAGEAGADIIPVQCIRSGGATISGNDGAADVGISNIAERPFPPNPLTAWDAYGAATYPSPAIDVFGDCDTSLTNGVILHANMRAFARVDPSSPGTGLLAVGSATLIYDFTVTGTEAALIQVHFNSNGPSATFHEAFMSMIHDGQAVYTLGIENGELIQSMNWEFGPGSWEIRAFGDVSIGTDPASAGQLGLVEMSIEITSVPAPAGLAALGVVLLAAGWRRSR